MTTAQPLSGRVFTRLQHYEALPTELQRDVEALEKFLTSSQSEIFDSHHTLKLKTVYGVRKQQLLDKIEAWVETHGEGLSHGHGGQVDRHHGVTHGHNATSAAHPRGGATTPTDQVISEKEHVMENLKKPMNAGFYTHTANASSTMHPVTAPTTTTTTSPLTSANVGTIGGGAVPAPVPVALLTPAHTHGARNPRALTLLDALVLKGFVTPHKEDKPKDAPTDGAEDLDFKDNELFEARGKGIAAAKDAGPSVWDLVDGAVFAGVIKRKAGLLEPLTHGKDTYAVVNSRLRNLTLFKTDLSRKAIMQFNTHALHVSLDKSHYDHGVKIWNETDTELLNAASAAESDALVEALVTAGASQSGAPGHGHTATKTVTTGEKLRHDATKVIGADHHDRDNENQHHAVGDHTATHGTQTQHKDQLTEGHASDMVHGSHHEATTHTGGDKLHRTQEQQHKGWETDKLHVTHASGQSMVPSSGGTTSHPINQPSPRTGDNAQNRSQQHGTDRTAVAIGQQYGTETDHGHRLPAHHDSQPTHTMQSDQQQQGRQGQGQGDGMPGNEPPGSVPHGNQPGYPTSGMPTQQEHQHEHVMEKLGLGEEHGSALHGNHPADEGDKTQSQQQHGLSADQTKPAHGEPRDFSQVLDRLTTP